MMKVTQVVLLAVVVAVIGCTPWPDPGVGGPYRSWDEVIHRWIGKSEKDLFYELGPPNVHSGEMVPSKDHQLIWDMTVDRMPGQADEYNLLPLTQSQTCQLIFLADPDGTIRSGRRVGCT